MKYIPTNIFLFDNAYVFKNHLLSEKHDKGHVNEYMFNRYWSNIIEYKAFKCLHEFLIDVEYLIFSDEGYYDVLLYNIDIEIEDDALEAVLSLAMSCNDSDMNVIMEELFIRGLDPNDITDVNNKSFYKELINHDYFLTLQTCFDYGLNPNLNTEIREILFHIDIDTHNLNRYEFMLMNGIDPNIKTELGYLLFSENIRKMIHGRQYEIFDILHRYHTDFTVKDNISILYYIRYAYLFVKLISLEPKLIEDIHNPHILYRLLSRIDNVILLDYVRDIPDLEYNLFKFHHNKMKVIHEYLYPSNTVNKHVMTSRLISMYDDCYHRDEILQILKLRPHLRVVDKIRLQNMDIPEDFREYLNI